MAADNWTVSKNWLADNNGELQRYFAKLTYCHPILNLMPEKQFQKRKKCKHESTVKGEKKPTETSTS